MTSLTNSNLELKNMFGQFMKMNTASSSGSATLPSNTITNLKEDLKGITTQSGNAYKGPMISTTYSPSKVVEYRFISRPVGVSEDVFVKVGTFHFPADFVVVHFNDDPLVPLILERSFLKTRRALIDVYEGELTLRIGKEVVTFNLGQISRYSADYDAMSGDILLLKEFLMMIHHHHLSLLKNSKLLNLPMKNILLMNHPRSNLRTWHLISNLHFLEGDDKLPIIIAKNLKDEEKSALIKVLKSHKQALAWKLFDIKGINLEFCTCKILMEDDFKPADLHQRRVNPKSTRVLSRCSWIFHEWNPTPSTKAIVFNSSPTLTPFGDNDFLLKETNAFLAIDDEPISSKIDGSYYDLKGDILLLKEFLMMIHHHHLSLLKNSKLLNLPMKNILLMNHPRSNLRTWHLISNLHFLEGDDKLPIIIAKNLKDEEKSALIKVLKSHKQALAWKLFDIKGINLEFCTCKILMEDDFKPADLHQRRVNPKSTR
nr:hypothetical protein [Tanacetum cinerariifolium]